MQGTGPFMYSLPRWKTANCTGQTSKATGVLSTSVKHHGESSLRTSHSTKISALTGIYNFLSIFLTHLQHIFIISSWAFTYLFYLFFFLGISRTNPKLSYKNVKAPALKLNPILSQCELEYFFKPQQTQSKIKCSLRQKRGIQAPDFIMTVTTTIATKFEYHMFWFYFASEECFGLQKNLKTVLLWRETKRGREVNTKDRRIKILWRGIEFLPTA